MNTPVIARVLCTAILSSALPLATLQAKTVTLSMDVEIDEVAPEDAGMYRVGGHDLDRVSYDDSKVDPVTHRVPVLSVGHFLGGHWSATAPDGSMLDMSTTPYRLTFEASVTHGRQIIALFEGDTMRMAMIARPDFRMLIAGKYTINPTPLTDAEVAAPPVGIDNPDTMPIRSAKMPAGGPGGAPPPRKKIVALDIDILVDQATPKQPGGPSGIGQHHNARVYYDESQIDPGTHRVAVLHQQHTSALTPKHLNAELMPMSNAWLDFSGTPIRYHYAAAPIGAGDPDPYYVLFDEQTLRMTIRRQTDGAVLLAGAYTVNPAQITGPEVDAAVASEELPIAPWASLASPKPSKESQGSGSAPKTH